MVNLASLATGPIKKRIQASAKQYEPEDPYYEFYEEAGSSKQKRRKRAPPPGLTKQQAKLLRKIARRAHYLDKGFNLCGIRFGWTFILGLIPGLGDLADAALNYFLVAKPAKKGFDLPDWVFGRMLANNAVSAGIGLVPLVGDIALAVWKANSRNAKLLEEYLRVVGEEQIKQGLPNLTPRTEHDKHPAQAAARELVHGSGSGSASAGQTTATATGASTRA